MVQRILPYAFLNMKLKFPKSVTIGSTVFKVVKDPNKYGGRVTFDPNYQIIIGTKLLQWGQIEKVFAIICHEVMEAWAVEMDYRTEKYNHSFQFNFDHHEWSILINCASKTISEFIV